MGELEVKTQEDNKYNILQYTYDVTFAKYLIKAGLVPIVYDFQRYPNTDITIIKELPR